MVLVIAAGGLLAALVDPAARQLLPAIGISLIVAAVGLADDFWNLPATPRLVTHAAAAIATVWIYGPIERIGLGGDTLALGVLAVPLTILWISWFINAFNFMDGIDGLAGMQALAASAVWLGIGAASGALGDGGSALAWAGALIGAASVGFLVHNWSRATVFLGDAGATTLGYWLATLPLLADAPWQSTTGVLVLWPFVFDATFILLKRIAAREPLIAGHRQHCYQRLTLTGLSHPIVVLLFGGLAALGALIGLATHMQRVNGTVAIVSIGVMASGLLLFVSHRERGASPGWRALAFRFPKVGVPEDRP